MPDLFYSDNLSKNGISHLKKALYGLEKELKELNDKKEAYQHFEEIATLQKQQNEYRKKSMEFLEKKDFNQSQFYFDKYEALLRQTEKLSKQQKRKHDSFWKNVDKSFEKQFELQKDIEILKCLVIRFESYSELRS
jgi:hypothetical protein